MTDMLEFFEVTQLSLFHLYLLQNALQPVCIFPLASAGFESPVQT